MTEKTGTEISEAMDNDFKYSKEDICNLCGVSDRTFDYFLASSQAKPDSDMTERDFIIVGPRKIIKNYMQKIVK